MEIKHERLTDKAEYKYGLHFEEIFMKYINKKIKYKIRKHFLNIICDMNKYLFNKTENKYEWFDFENHNEKRKILLELKTRSSDYINDGFYISTTKLLHADEAKTIKNMDIIFIYHIQNSNTYYFYIYEPNAYIDLKRITTRYGYCSVIPKEKLHKNINDLIDFIIKK